MYNEIIAALEQAATDDSVITVVTGTHTHTGLCVRSCELPEQTTDRKKSQMNKVVLLCERFWFIIRPADVTEHHE